MYLKSWYSNKFLIKAFTTFHELWYTVHMCVGSWLRKHNIQSSVIFDHAGLNYFLCVLAFKGEYP